MAFSFLRILTYILGLVGTSMLLPLGVALWKGESAVVPAFLLPMLAGWSVAIAFWLLARGRPRVFDVQHAFGTVGGIWVAICLFGALPLLFSGCFPSFTDAVFESVSGFTTTGASVLSDVEGLPCSVNLWRCETHWLGGLGVIALAVALIPLLGIGGFRLIKAETTGPDKAKLTSLIANTAKTLWFIYMALTAVQALLLWHAGMGAVDALAHAFSTMGTGGFSTRNASVGAFGLPAAEWICTAFMLLASVNFTLYYRMLTGRLGEVARDSELRTFIALVFGAVVFATAVGWRSWDTAGVTLRAVAFQVSSIVSTTGFMTDDYLAWRPAAQVTIFLLFFIGGCSGSTAGGIKVIRWTILGKQLRGRAGRARRVHGLYGSAQHGGQRRAGVRTARADVQLRRSRRPAKVVLHVRDARGAPGDIYAAHPRWPSLLPSPPCGIMCAEIIVSNKVHKEHKGRRREKCVDYGNSQWLSPACWRDAALRRRRRRRGRSR